MAQEHNVLEQITTDCMVKSKAEMPDGWKVELEVPHFQSRFPTICTRVDAELAGLLKVGVLQRLTLNRESLKKDGAGKPKTGQYWSDYYWGLAAIAPVGGLAQTPSPPSQRQESVAPPPGLHEDSGKHEKPQSGWVTEAQKQVSIERQKAAAIAFDAAREGEDIEATLKRAERIYGWIAQEVGLTVAEGQKRDANQPAPSEPTPVPAGDRLATGAQKNVILTLQGKLGDPPHIPEHLSVSGASEVIKRLQERADTKPRRG